MNTEPYPLPPVPATPRPAFAPLRILALSTPARGHALLLLLLLTIEASELGEAPGGAAMLAATTGLSERTVRHWLHWLQSAGELQPLGRYGPHHSLVYAVTRLGPSSPAAIERAPGGSTQLAQIGY